MNFGARVYDITCAAAVCAALGAVPEPADAADSENDTLFKTIHEFCIDLRGTVDDAARHAIKKPFRPRQMGADKGPPYKRTIGLELGSGNTLLTFESLSQKTPVSTCMFVSYSDNLAELLTRMKSAFALAEPKPVPVMHEWWETTGRATTNGRETSVKLQYGLQDNKRAGAFTLTVTR